MYTSPFWIHMAINISESFRASGWLTGWLSWHSYTDGFGTKFWRQRCERTAGADRSLRPNVTNGTISEWPCFWFATKILSENGPGMGSFSSYFWAGPGPNSFVYSRCAKKTNGIATGFWEIVCFRGLRMAQVFFFGRGNQMGEVVWRQDFWLDVDRWQDRQKLNSVWKGNLI